MPQAGRRSASRGEEGASSIIGFAVAITVFAIVFSAFLVFTQSPGLVSYRGADLGARSEGSAAQILGSSGQTSSGLAWNLDPDRMTRFGLATTEGSDVLDLDKLRNLTRGNMTTDPANHLLDYGEAKAALGLGAEDFHLRTYPLLPTPEGGPPISGMRVAYIGDWAGGNQGGAPLDVTAALADAGSAVYLNVTLHNNGVQGSVFQSEASFALDGGVVADTANTAFLLPDGAQQVSLRLNKTAAWAWAGSDRNVTLQVTDSQKSLATLSVDLGAIDMKLGSSPYALLLVSPDKVSYKNGSKPVLSYDVLDGAGNAVKNVDVDVQVRYAGNGTLYAEQVVKTSASNRWTLPSTPTGNYSVRIFLVSDASSAATDWIQVLDDPGSFSSGGGSAATEQPSSKAERAMLLSLVQGFQNTTYDAGGDVYPDTKAVMNNDLASNLTATNGTSNTTAYQALVVGSGVDQTAMTSAAAKDAVRDFVLRGGLLVVLGSQAQQVTWLQPLFHASLTTSGGGISAPDASNPILHSPMDLRYQTYADNNMSWQFNTAAEASHFTDVLMRAGATQTEDTLAVSKPGNFGSGTIVLTGWQPFNLTRPQDAKEGRNTLYNFLSQALGALYIDFGPVIPGYSEVASATRLATAPHPWLKGDAVLVRVVMYTFG